MQGSLAAAMAMDGTCLYVQGPPGSGKTYTGSRMIAGLLAAGRRVGIMSNSHKAINHLLQGVMEVVAERGQQVRAVKKATRDRPGTAYDDDTGGVVRTLDRERRRLGVRRTAGGGNGLAVR